MLTLSVGGQSSSLLSLLLYEHHNKLAPVFLTCGATLHLKTLMRSDYFSYSLSVSVMPMRIWLCEMGLLPSVAFSFLRLMELICSSCVKAMFWLRMTYFCSAKFDMRWDWRVSDFVFSLWRCFIAFLNRGEIGLSTLLIFVLSKSKLILFVSRVRNT